MHIHVNNLLNVPTPGSDPHHEHFLTHDNHKKLVGNAVCKIVQGPGGVIWFAMASGLACYRSLGVKNYRCEPRCPESISSNQITSMLCDSHGVLWVGTPKGLNRYNALTDTFTLFVNNSSDLNSLSDNRIRALAEDSRGNLWVGVADGVNCLHLKGDQIQISRFYFQKEHDEITGAIIHDLHIDLAGTVWVGTSLGLARSDSNKMEAESFEAGSDKLERRPRFLIFECKHGESEDVDIPGPVSDPYQAKVHDEWKELAKKLKHITNSSDTRALAGSLPTLLIEHLLQHEKAILPPCDRKFLENLIEIIEQHISDRGFTITKLSKLVGMSQSVLYKKVKSLTNKTLNDLIKAIRLAKGAIFLRHKKCKINDISILVGFEDSKYFSKEFKKRFGQAPKNWASL
jgi:AraC-like DNA-binding protein